MNKQELTELLVELAEKDLTEGCDISRHPCFIAVTAINECFKEIRFLQRVADGKANVKSKRAVRLLRMDYSPEW